MNAIPNTMASAFITPPELRTRQIITKSAAIIPTIHHANVLIILIPFCVIVYVHIGGSEICRIKSVNFMHLYPCVYRLIKTPPLLILVQLVKLICRVVLNPYLLFGA